MDKQRPPRPAGPTFSVNSKEEAAMKARIFIGNLPTDRMNGPKELEDMFSKYGPVHDSTLHKGFGFVQFGNEQDAWKAIQGEAGALHKGLRLDVKVAVENRGRKPEERDRSPLARAGGGAARDSTSGSTINEPCRYFKMGNCTRGASCFYRHEEPDGGRHARPPNDRGFQEPGPDRDMAMRPDRDMAMRPDRDMAMRPDRDMAMRPDRDMALRPDRDMAMRPDRDMAMRPDRDMAMRPDRDMAMRPDRDMAMRPDRDMPMRPDRDMPMRPDRDMPMRPDRDGFGDRGQRPGPFQRDRGDFPGAEGRPRPRDREPFDESRGPRPMGPPYEPYMDSSFQRDQFRNEYDRPYDAAPGPGEERRDYPPVGKPLKPAFERPPVDCVLIACHQQQRGYCEMVERRLRSLNIRTSVQVPKDKEGVQEALEEATKRGVPYAIIVTSQNEVHRSLTLNILHGTPQEHRNMPLEDALGLVGRTFDEYMDNVRQKQLSSPAQKRPAAGDAAGATAGGITPPDSSLAYLLNLMADGHELTLNELEAVFTYVQKRKDRATALAVSDPSASADVRRSREAVPQGVPPGDRMPVSRDRGPAPGGPSSHSTGTINFENPMVQRAMENITSAGNFAASGPSALQKPKIQPLVPGMADRPNRPFDRGFNSYY